MSARIAAGRIVTLAAAMALALALAGCSGGTQTTPQPGRDGGLQVVASFYPIAFFAERIAGDSAQVFNPVPPGAEPHDLELSPRTVERVQSADLLLYLGGGFQPAVDRALDTLKGSGLVAADVSEGITKVPAQNEEGTQQSGALDPHVWLDPQYATVMANNIERALAQADPANEATYRANADKLRADLDALDSEFRQGLSGCARKDIVVSHAAFGYLARRYGLVEVPVSGLSPEAEPSPSRLNEVIKFVREHDVKYIFFETLVSPRVGEVIAGETGAQTLVLNPVEGLTEEQAAAGADYFSLMRENLANLRIGLDCK
jgi:zinc transport system substrate-binding protein